MIRSAIALAAIVIGCALLICRPAVVVADPAPPSQILATDDPHNKLHLTPAQQQQILNIGNAATVRMNSIRNNASMSDQAKQTAAQSLIQQVQQQEFAVLTPDQQTTVQQHRSAQASYQKGMQAEAAKIQGLDQQLHASLTAAQQTQVAGITKQIQAYAAQLGANSKLTVDQKDQMMAAKQKTASAQLLSILTPSQHTLYSQLRDDQKELMALEKLFTDEGL
jgi:hypothetical protein